MAKRFYEVKTVVYPVNKFTGENDCPAENNNCNECPHCSEIGRFGGEDYVDCEYPDVPNKNK